MSDHISDLRWDELIAGDLDADAEATARAHAASCTSCAARLAELTAEARAFALPLRRRRVPWFTIAGAVAAAAIAVIVLRPSDPGTRTKGPDGAKLVLVDARGRVLAAGDRIAPHDTLQATYTAAHDGFGAVLSRDGAGTTSVYVPSRGDRMVALPAGEGRTYPESTVLDAVTGAETIVLVWCERALPLAALKIDAPAPPGCTLHRVELDKR